MHIVVNGEQFTNHERGCNSQIMNVVDADKRNNSHLDIQ